MASVHLTFSPPDREDITKLHIYESANPLVFGAIIETVTAVGTYPNYIDEYTTNLATSNANWFRIQWEDSKGAKSDVSSAMQGGTETLVGKIVDRVHERNVNLSTAVVRQEAEAVIQTFYGDGTDPYDVTLNPSYRVLNGMVYWALARSSLAESITSSDVSSATIGLVTLRSGTQTQAKTVDLKALFDIAFAELGIGLSVVMQIEEVLTVYGGPKWLTRDQIREIVEP